MPHRTSRAGGPIARVAPTRVDPDRAKLLGGDSDATGTAASLHPIPTGGPPGHLERDLTSLDPDRGAIDAFADAVGAPSVFPLVPIDPVLDGLAVVLLVSDVSSTDPGTRSSPGPRTHRSR